VATNFPEEEERPLRREEDEDNISERVFVFLFFLLRK
jgi:hypothetical protein